jgi:hypothetical protein
MMMKTVMTVSSLVAACGGVCPRLALILPKARTPTRGDFSSAPVPRAAVACSSGFAETGADELGEFSHGLVRVPAGRGDLDLLTV